MKNLLKMKAILEKRISDEKITKILEEAGEKVKDDIQGLAPIDTGRYRSSIMKSPVNKENSYYYVSIYSELNSGWNNIPLGYLLEWGTGERGEATNDYDHGYPYRSTPWVYYNERYGRWIFTHGNIARPHFYPGLKLNERYFKELIKKVIVNDE